MRELGARVAANIRALREHRGMSQAALARAMKDRGYPWHQATAYRIETGQQPVGLEEAAELAAVLGVTLDRLTWATGEAAEQMAADQAITVLREAARDAAVALARLLAARRGAELAARDAGRSKYGRVRETAKAIETELEDATVQNAIAEGGRQWEDMRDGK